VHRWQLPARIPYRRDGNGGVEHGGAVSSVFRVPLKESLGLTWRNWAIKSAVVVILVAGYQKVWP
jgi:hypothetical protein